jgi:hypothetical protein
MRSFIVSLFAAAVLFEFREPAAVAFSTSAVRL